MRERKSRAVLRPTIGHMTSISLVTGAAGGLGAAVARRLAARGDTVFAADLDTAAVAGTVDAIADAGGAAVALAMDVTDEDAVDAAFAEIDAIGPLENVVHCAGIAFGSPLTDTSLARWEALMRVNVTGTFLVVREAARRMTPRGEGAIVAIASTSSFTASSSPMAAYDASKAAVHLFVKSAARELAPVGIRVNAVAPGTMDTALVRGLGGTDADLADLAAARIPAGRLGGTDEVAEAAAWLTSPAASYVIGHTLVVDGGWLT